MKFWQNALLATTATVGMAFSADAQNGIGPGKGFKDRNPNDGRRNDHRTEDCRVQTRAEILHDNPWLDKDSLMKNKHNNDNYRLDSIIWHNDYADVYTMFYTACPDNGRSANLQTVLHYNNLEEQEKIASGREYYGPIRSKDDQLLAEQLVVSAAVDASVIPESAAKEPPSSMQIVFLRDLSVDPDKIHVQTNYLNDKGDVVGQRLSEMVPQKGGEHFMNLLKTEAGFGGKGYDIADGPGRLVQTFYESHMQELGYQENNIPTVIRPNSVTLKDAYFKQNHKGISVPDQYFAPLQPVIPTNKTPKP